MKQRGICYLIISGSSSCVIANHSALKNALYLSMTLQVDILNPKATKLLKDLEDLKLISIKKDEEDGFLKVVKRIRSKAATKPPTLEEITKVVESVRSKRYAQKK